MTTVIFPSASNAPMAGGEALIEIRNLRVEYGAGDHRIVAIPDLSLTIRRGESYGLVGESGCGKTTAAMAIMGYLGRNGFATRGSIQFEGEDLLLATPARLARIRGKRIAMVYQEPSASLNPTMTIGRQLAEVPELHDGLSRAAATQRVLDVLADVRMPDPEQVVRRFPHQLSGGQQQRVVIAMALLAHPALLLLDEPTTGLDVTVEAAVLDLIGLLREKYETSLLYISHNLGLIATTCDRVGIMYSGEMVEEAPVIDLFRKPTHPYTRGLLDCIPDLASDKRTRTLSSIPGQFPLPHERPSGCVFGPRCGDFVPGRCDQHPVPLEPATQSHLVRCLRWSEIEPKPAVRVSTYVEPEAMAPILDIDRLSKSYELGGMSWSRNSVSTVKANEDLSFSVRQGEILAVVGESGCGKSTFAKVLTGLETATSGGIFFANQDIARRAVHQRSQEVKRAIQMIFQNPDSTLNPSHAVDFSIRRSITKSGVRKGAAAIAGRVAELFDLVRLPRQFQKRRPDQLSGGQKQRIAIARAFASEPRLIIADEPVSALDVSVQAAVITLLLDLQARDKTTMIFISHDLALVRHVADRVVVMYLGRVMEQGRVEEIFSPPYHPYTEALLSAIPIPDPTKGRGRRVRLTGDIPSPVNPPAGCRFTGRCPRKLGEICDSVPPPEHKVSSTHTIACHLPLDQLVEVTSVIAAE
ncbi:MAG TPA: ABC transporter ATP-binding protein [Bradyrhizobium sp.]|nr:ABC transporter ATP-binding protein [Bradyrhizobium sp.]